MKNINILGIDLAKNVFQLHGADNKGRCVLSKRLARNSLATFISKLPVCTIAIEACGSSHYWARVFEHMGHTVKMIAPQFVKPYVKSNKNDRNDAAAIAEACSRPEMKFVPIKRIEQQDILLLHRARELQVKHRTALSNQIRGLLAEYGIIINKGASQIRKLALILDDNQDKLTPRSIAVFNKLNEQFKNCDAEVKTYDREIELVANQDTLCKELMKMEGIGPVTASAATATIGDAKLFKNGREVSAWLGLVPKQHSSGDKIRLGGISKRGDCYLRKLLINGARTVIKNCEHKTDAKSLWAADKKKRCGYNKAAVALANKSARVIWAIMATGECYRSAKAA